MSEMTTREIGVLGERRAVRYLCLHGYWIKARNWYAGKCELDIVAKDGQYLVFTEVKTRSRTPRSTEAKLAPRKSLRPEQKKRIIRGAHAFLKELDHPPVRYRFDLIEVVLNAYGVESICHTMSAFGESIFSRRSFLYAG